ncbi:MAG: hypothetical protein ACK5IB_10385 [Qingshengfaniella sp.]
MAETEDTAPVHGAHALRRGLWQGAAAGTLVSALIVLAVALSRPAPEEGGVAGPGLQPAALVAERDGPAPAWQSPPVLPPETRGSDPISLADRGDSAPPRRAAMLSDLGMGADLAVVLPAPPAPLAPAMGRLPVLFPDPTGTRGGAPVPASPGQPPARSRQAQGQDMPTAPQGNPGPVALIPPPVPPVVSGPDLSDLPPPSAEPGVMSALQAEDPPLDRSPDPAGPVAAGLPAAGPVAPAVPSLPVPPGQHPVVFLLTASGPEDSKAWAAATLGDPQLPRGADLPLDLSAVRPVTGGAGAILIEAPLTAETEQDLLDRLIGTDWGVLVGQGADHGMVARARARGLRAASVYRTIATPDVAAQSIAAAARRAGRDGQAVMLVTPAAAPAVSTVLRAPDAPVAGPLTRAFR